MIHMNAVLFSLKNNRKAIRLPSNILLRTLWDNMSYPYAALILLWPYRKCQSNPKIGWLKKWTSCFPFFCVCVCVCMCVCFGFFSFDIFELINFYFLESWQLFTIYSRVLSIHIISYLSIGHGLSHPWCWLGNSVTTQIYHLYLYVCHSFLRNRQTFGAIIVGSL